MAQSVIEAALELGRREGLGRISRVALRIGELQRLDLEVFSFAIEEMKRGTALDGAEFSYETEEALLRCAGCGHTWRYRDSIGQLTEEEREAIHFIPETIHLYIRCPRCGSVDFEPVKGRGVSISHVE